MTRAGNRAAGLAKTFGSQARAIWGSVDAPAIHYNLAVQNYQGHSDSLRGWQLEAAQYILRYYRSYCAGHLAFRDLVRQLLPGCESDFDEGYGDHPELKPLPF